MLNTLKIPPEVVAELRDQVPHNWQCRMDHLTAEEQFYCVRLIQFKTKEPARALFYLVLKARLIRYLRCKQKYLFSEPEWRSLERVWKEDFLKYCLKEVA